MQRRAVYTSRCRGHLDSLELSVEGQFKVESMTGTTLYNRLKNFIESEGKSCSFDPGLITPEYVYRMWGGAVAIEDIATAMVEVRRMM